MPPLLSHPPAMVAEKIPAGVASTDGRLYFVSSPHGIDALDAETGAPAWSTTEASVPVLALPDTLLAIRGADPADDVWAGRGTLVAIDLAAPHAARSGAPFELPLDRHRLLDVRTEGDALVAGWHATSTGGGPLVRRPADRHGSIRIDLATGAATITETPHVPDAVRQVLASVTTWLPPWRTRTGWSALAMEGAATALSMTLRRWLDAGEAPAIPLLDQLDPRTASAPHATARHAFVHTCDPGAPERCQLRVYDAETGAQIRTLPDPFPARLGPPFALIGDRFLAVQRSPVPGGSDRALVAIDASAASAASGPRWQYPLAPEPAPDARP